MTTIVPRTMSVTFDHLFRNFAVYKMQKLLCNCNFLQSLVYKWFDSASTPEGIRYYIYGNIHAADIVILYFNGSAFLPTQPPPGICELPVTSVKSWNQGCDYLD